MSLSTIMRYEPARNFYISTDFKAVKQLGKFNIVCRGTAFWKHT